MKIVSINVHYQDKLGYQDYYLGKEMQKMGHEIHFISSDRHFDYPDYERTIEHIIGPKYVGIGTFINDYDVPVYRLGINKTIKKLTSRIWLKNFKSILFELQPDFIISHGILSFQSIRLAYWAKRLNCPIVYDDHTTSNLIRNDKKSAFIFWLFRILFAKKITQSADKLVGISETCIGVMDEYFGMVGKKIQMIPLGTDTNIFKKDEQLRKNYRAKILDVHDETTIVILYTGKIYEDKSVHLIMEALNDETINQGKNILIHIVGDVSEKYQHTFQEAIKNSKYPVIYKKALPVNELPAVYNAADVSVWPNHTTTSTIDASACGSPIICSHFMPERVKYDNGFLVKGGDLEDLKIALKKLIKDKALRQKMIQNGISYVENELSWNAIANKFLK